MILINILNQENWSPYLAGAGIGILSWFTFLLSNKPIGCSTAYANLFGFIDRFISKKKFYQKSYYTKFKIKIDWQVMFVFGIVLGSFLATILSNGFKINLVPELWSINIGSSIFFRYIISFIGGILIGFGSRLSNGCTSGHGISGTMQLSFSSWFIVIIFFSVAIVTANIIY